MPSLPGTSIEGVAKGAYTIRDVDGTPDVMIMGTGSELQLCIDAVVILDNEGELLLMSQRWFLTSPT